MAKKHDTFPGEQPEMPAPVHKPEINKPFDPKVPEIPKEDPGNVPDEVPPSPNPPEDPGVV